MQTSSRPRETGPSSASRRAGRIPQIAINNDGHHVTEAIGHMYGDGDGQESETFAGQADSFANRKRLNGRPNNVQQEEEMAAPKRNSIPRKQLPERKISTGQPVIRRKVEQSPFPDVDTSWQRSNGTPPSPDSYRGRSPSETATSQFPLNDIDYESSPAAVAQELSNLQALRRMSMDVAAAGDPDLPTLNPAAVPASPSQREDDDSRLYWVPAGIHPELAPREFKSFLESKAEQIKRRSGELSSFQSSSRSSSLSVGNNSGLQRKKSMLSRQINTSSGYQDGADRLESKRSHSRRNGSTSNDPNLLELEALVAENATGLPDNTKSVSEEVNGDIILPSIPGSNLKRSTRTQYSKRGGSLRGRGSERPSYAQRAARRAGASGAGDVPPLPSSSPDMPSLPSFTPSHDISNLAQTLRDPTAQSSARSTTNFSRPATGTTSSESTPRASFASTAESLFTRPEDTPRSSTSSLHDLPNLSAISPLQRQKAYEIPYDAPQYRQQIPQIIESPPVEEYAGHESYSSQASSSFPPPQPPQQHLPERTSSREDPQRIKANLAQRPSLPPKQSSSFTAQRIPATNANAVPPQQQATQSLGEMSSHPSPLPGNDTNTSNLAFIPTLTEDKRADFKKKEKKDDKKSTWGWLLGKEEAEKEKPRAKSPKSAEKSHDNARLDLLQSSIDGNPKGRESLVLDRDTFKLEEERKKESQRKSTGSDTKKEKESLFSTIFGGKKAKGEKDGANSGKKHHLSRGLSPEPPYRELKADIDYNWTRFSILEERAIYRMAHIKLANPRRALYSQVLLSNFMYSYLAKVQQMHPQMNLPTSAKQQKKQQQAGAAQGQGQGQTGQPDEYTQYQRYQQQQQQQADDQQHQAGGVNAGAVGTNDYHQHHQEQQQYTQHQQHQPDQPYSDEGQYDDSTEQPMYDDYEHHNDSSTGPTNVNLSQRPMSRGSKSGGPDVGGHAASYNSNQDHSRGQYGYIAHGDHGHSQSHGHGQGYNGYSASTGGQRRLDDHEDDRDMW